MDRAVILLIATNVLQNITQAEFTLPVYRKEVSSGLGLPSADGPRCKLLRAVRKCCLPSPRHPLAKIFFKSYPAVVREQQRHLQPDQALIHPLSSCSLVWNSLIVLVQLARMCAAPLRLCFVIDPISTPQLHLLDYIMLPLQTICLLDILVKLNTGLLNEQEHEITLNRKHVLCEYLTGWFTFDLVTAFPMGFLVVQQTVDSGPAQLVVHALPILANLKTVYVLDQMSILFEIMFKSYTLRTLLRHFVVFAALVHWCACSVYLVTIVRYYWTGIETVDYNKLLELDMTPLSQVDFLIRYWEALFVSLVTFLGTGFSMYKVYRPDEIVISVFIILGSTIFMVYTVVLLLDLYMTQRNSSTRYHEMIDQLKNYMRSKQLPPELKNRMLRFYEYKFQKKYFREESVINDLSDHLREETELDMRRKLIEDVELFAGMPKSVVGAILACLHPEVYLPNDLIISAGEIGDSMYFISCGTIAIYTPKGVEVKHLEDGSHFGEVALLMNDMRRVATAVAIETTEIYRLDRADFGKYVMTCASLYDRLKVIATERISEIVRLAETHHRSKETTSTEALAPQ